MLYRHNEIKERNIGRFNQGFAAESRSRCSIIEGSKIPRVLELS